MTESRSLSIPTSLQLPPQTKTERAELDQNMVALASMSGVVWGILHWLCDVMVLLLVGAFLAETSPSLPSQDATGLVSRDSPGER